MTKSLKFKDSDVFEHLVPSIDGQIEPVIKDSQDYYKQIIPKNELQPHEVEQNYIREGKLSLQNLKNLSFEDFVRQTLLEVPIIGIESFYLLCVRNFQQRKQDPIQFLPFLEYVSRFAFIFPNGLTTIKQKHEEEF